MIYPGKSPQFQEQSLDSEDRWVTFVQESLESGIGPFLFIGGTPPVFSWAAESFWDALSPGTPLPGEPWWTLLRRLGKEPWEAKLTTAPWPAPLIPPALKCLSVTPSGEEPAVDEEIPYFRKQLPLLLAALVKETLEARGPLVADLGDGDCWSSLSREVLDLLMNTPEVPAVFLVKVKKSLDTQNLVDPRKVDGRFIRWESGAFLIPEEDDSSGVSDPAAWVDRLEGGVDLGCRDDVLTLVSKVQGPFPALEEIRLFQIQARALVLAGKPDEALSPAQLALSRAENEGNLPLKSASYLLLAKIFQKRGDQTGASRMIQAALSLPAGSLRHQLSRRLAEFLVLHGGVNWQSRPAKELEEILLPLLRDLEQAGWFQNWAYLATQASLVLHVNNEGVLGGAQRFILRALARARRAGNGFRLAQGYQTLGILHQEKQQYKEARSAYLRSYRIRKSWGSGTEIAGLEIGLGYFHISIGRYRESRLYLDRALNRIQETEAYGEAAAALYNLGVCAYFSGHGDHGAEALYRGLDLMNRAGILHLPFTHRSDFHGVLGLCHLGEGRQAAAWDQLKKAKSLLPPQGGMNLLLPQLLQGLLSRDDRILEGLRSRLLKNPEPQRHIYMDLLLRWAVKSRSRGENQKSGALLDEGRVWLEGRDIFPWHQDIFSGRLNLEDLRGSPDWPAQRLPDLRLMLKMVEQDRNLKNLSRQYHLTRFLNGVHRLTNSPGKGSPLPQLLLHHIFQYFPLKQGWVLFLPAQGDRIFQVRTAQFLESPALTWKDLWIPEEWEEPGTGLLDHSPWRGQFPPDERGFWIPLEGGQGGRGLLLGVLNGEMDLDQDQLQALALGGHQMIMSIELAGAWELLEQAAHKDSLTGLWNRRSMPSQFSALVSRRSQRPKELLSILYLDLDNFKDVNDICGHGAGDEVLVWFSKALQGLTRMGDSAVRVGGDEFVVFLPGEGWEGARSLATRIVELFQSLPPDLGFLKQNNIRELGCSIGIYSGTLTESLPLDHWLSRADKALYQAKAQGKNRWAVYEGD